MHNFPSANVVGLGQMVSTVVVSRLLGFPFGFMRGTIPAGRTIQIIRVSSR